MCVAQTFREKKTGSHLLTRSRCRETSGETHLISIEVQQDLHVGIGSV
jgi:hypothetical protein